MTGFLLQSVWFPKRESGSEIDRLSSVSHIFLFLSFFVSYSSICLFFLLILVSQSIKTFLFFFFFLFLPKFQPEASIDLLLLSLPPYALHFRSSLSFNTRNETKQNKHIPNLTTSNFNFNKQAIQLSAN